MKTKFNGILTLLLALVVQITFAQEKQISGTVSDETGPLPGVSVIIKGTSTGSETDFDGLYTIKAKPGDVLVFSYVGMNTVSKTVRTSSQINITMKSSNLLDEVIVVAYGTAKKSSIVGSVATVSQEVLQNVQSSNVAKALEGAISGVQVVASSGQPGSAPSIKIRGIGSINSSNDPLYVLDGIPFEGNINSIPQSDIASINVLKDAAANSLYGARGSNGVILITTKRGKNGKMTVSLSAKTGVNSRAINDYSIIKSPKDYYELFWQAIKGRNISNGQTDAEAALNASNSLVTELGGYNNYDVPNNELVGVDGKLNPNANLLYQDSWEDEFFKNGFRKEYSLNVRGGSDKARYFFSSSYLSDEGYVARSDFERLTTRLNLEMNLTEDITISSSLSYSNTTSNSPTSSGNSYTNSFQWSRGIAPIYPVFGYSPTGEPVYYSNGDRAYDFGDNEFGGARVYGAGIHPLASNILDIKERGTDNFNSNLSFKYNFLEDFNFTYNFSAQLYNSNYSSWQNNTYGSGAGEGSDNGSGYQSAGRQQVITNQQLLTYTKQLGGINVDVLVGHESYKLNYKNLNGTKANFLLSDNANFDFAALTKQLSSYTQDYSVEGYLSRLKLNYDEKYFVSGSLRYDASSVFHQDNRWGSFWSTGAGWIVSKEDFLADSSWITTLKLKGSYGTQGNDAILYGNGARNYYAYQDQYKVTGNAANELTTTKTFSGNKDVTWEKSNSFNFGIEGRLFNRLSFNAEYFEKRTTDLLFLFKKSSSLGIPDVPRNIGDMKNWGFELEINADIIQSEDFNWNVSINTTSVKNKVTKLATEFKDGITNGTKLISEGHSIYGFNLVESAGVDETNGNALYWQDVIELDGEGVAVIDENENVIRTGERIKTDEYSDALQYSKKYVGDALPDFYGGLVSTMDYKGFDLGIQLSYQIGGDIYDGVQAGLMGAGEAGDNWSTDIFNAWTPTNTITDVPRLDISSQDANSRSSRFLYDASYLSLKNVTFGYSLPESFIEKAHMTSFRIFVVGDNLKLWSKRQGLDPRQYSSGTTGQNYAPIKTLSLGVNVQF
ncbi:MAG: TonB-dependent receptor [Flavobacteriaceae bacterium]|nr:TonB-dependent receptor [Flavobacteriaceae bacterium]